MFIAIFLRRSPVVLFHHPFLRDSSFDVCDGVFTGLSVGRYDLRIQFRATQNRQRSRTPGDLSDLAGRGRLHVPVVQMVRKLQSYPPRK